MDYNPINYYISLQLGSLDEDLHLPTEIERYKSLLVLIFKKFNASTYNLKCALFVSEGISLTKHDSTAKFGHINIGELVAILLLCVCDL